jgi:gas vesicle protein
MAMAATAMYFLDPERGEQRRRELREKIQGYRKSAEQTGRDLAKTV